MEKNLLNNAEIEENTVEQNFEDEEVKEKINKDMSESDIITALLNSNAMINQQ